MDENDDIREPDLVKTETLFEPNLYDYSMYNEEEMLEIIMKQSIYEFENLKAIDEEKVLVYLATEKTKRREKYVTVKHKINKILKLDRENTEIYETILNIITLYEEEDITVYKIGQEELDKIFNVLNTIRLTKEEIEAINVLIIC